jgi:hypothetical protein
VQGLGFRYLDERWLSAAFWFTAPFILGDDLTTIYGLSALPEVHEANPLMVHFLPVLGPFLTLTIGTVLYIALVGFVYYLGVRWVSRGDYFMARYAFGWLLMFGVIKAVAVGNNLYVLAHVLGGVHAPF